MEPNALIRINSVRTTLLAVTCSLALGGCFDSGADAEDSNGHVWKDQTRTIDEARSVGDTLKDAAGKQLDRSQ